LHIVHLDDGAAQQHLQSLHTHAMWFALCPAPEHAVVQQLWDCLAELLAVYESSGIRLKSRRSAVV
jgi:hypothetical protein